MKELNIIEAIKMPIGTEFEVILNGEEFGCVAKIIESNVQSKKQLVWNNRANSSIVVTDSISRAIFTPIQQPVSFMEALNAYVNGKTIKCEYVEFNGNKATTVYKYGDIDECMEDYSGCGISPREVISGKWFIEE